MVPELALEFDTVHNLFMAYFRETTYLTDIIEESHNNPVIIFKYSNDCNSSSVLKKELESKGIKSPIYLVTVQIHKALSQKIEEAFKIKHESPQIIILDKNKVTYTAHHENIKINDIIRIHEK